ncbi:MAG: radical SAM family heme chaperone HemW [Pseudomonadota bacterium]
MAETPAFGVYVHWPFCSAKCPYCDFNSHVRSGVDQEAWADAFARDIAYQAERTGPQTVKSVFFGGGTPSLMEPRTVEAVLRAIDLHWGLPGEVEISLEANPTSVEAGKFAGFRAAGVNRVSLGVQALNDRDLRRLGRQHSAQEAREAFDVARRAFERVSFDLIYARPGQSADDWATELEQAIALAVDHLSLYQLTIEPGTRFWDVRANGGLKGLPDENLGAELYEITQEICDQNGMPSYEVSNHSRPGAESQHNLIYWRYGFYAGVGPGAHGRLPVDDTRVATETAMEPTEWLSTVERQGHGIVREENLDRAEQSVEALMMGMRLREGVPLTRLSEPPSVKALDALQSEGLLWRAGERIGATPRGKAVLNSLLYELVG